MSPKDVCKTSKNLTFAKYFLSTYFSLSSLDVPILRFQATERRFSKSGLSSKALVIGSSRKPCKMQPALKVAMVAGNFKPNSNFSSIFLSKKR